MKLSAIAAAVGHVPFISKSNGEYLYDLIMREKPKRILELGIAHGTATCYMAAALEELGEGAITAVDLLEVRDSYVPSAERQLLETGLERFASIHRMQSGYSWFLHEEIIRNTKADICEEVYDLCIIDGPKNWTIDGGAFFLVDKLLKRGGWIIFDDYNWTYSKADKLRESTDGITHRTLSVEEQETPHIRDVFEYLVKQHPSYGKLILLPDGDWALAQKTESSGKNYSVVYRHDIYGKVMAKIQRLPRSIFKLLSRVG